MVPGQPASLGWRAQPEGRPGPRELLVRILGVPLAPVDHRTAAGLIGSGLGFQVLGSRAYGRVAARGSAVTGWRDHAWVWVPEQVPDGCPACLAGEPDVCQGQALVRGVSRPDGTLQPLLVVPVDAAIPIKGAAVDAAPVLGDVALAVKALDLAARLQRVRFWRPRTVRCPETPGAGWTVARRLLAAMGVVPAGPEEPADLVLAAAGDSPGPVARDGVVLVLAPVLAEAGVVPATLDGNALVWRVSGTNRSHIARAGTVLGDLERETPGFIQGLLPPRLGSGEAIAALRGEWSPRTVEFAPI